MTKILVPKNGTLTGKKFHHWTVLKMLPYKRGKKQAYQCRCKCGIEKPVQATNLVRGASKSCGCRPFTVKRRGKKFKPFFYGNFYIESIAGYYGKQQTIAIYNVKCSCGNKKQIKGMNYKFQTGCSKDCPHTKERLKEVYNKS